MMRGVYRLDGCNAGTLAWEVNPSIAPGISSLASMTSRSGASSSPESANSSTGSPRSGHRTQVSLDVEASAIPFLDDTQVPEADIVPALRQPLGPGTEVPLLVIILRSAGAEATGRGWIETLSMLAQHAVGTDLWRAEGQAGAHPLHPVARDSACVARIEFRDNLVFEQVIHCLGLSFIPFRLRIFPPVAQRPARCAGDTSAHQPSNSERFRPPFASTFIPLVPQASRGRRGVLSQKSICSPQQLGAC